MSDSVLKMLMQLDATETLSAIFKKVSDSGQTMGAALRDSAKVASDGSVALSGSTNALKDAQDKAAAAAQAHASALADLAEAQTKLETSAAGIVTSEDAQAQAAERVAAAQQAVSDSSAKMGAAQETLAAKTTANTATQDASSASSAKLGAGAITSMALVAGGIGFVIDKTLQAATAYNTSTTTLQNNAQLSVGAAQSIAKAFLGTAGSATFSAQEIMSAYSPVSGELGNVEGHALSSAEAMSVMHAAMDLADASGSSLGNSTNDLATIMKLYGMNSTQAAGASNDLYNVSRLAGVGIDSVSSTLNKLAPALVGTNVSFGQTSGLILEMTDQLGNGRRAISTIGTAMQALTEPMPKAQAAMAGLGISLKDANGQFIGIGPALDQLKSKLGSQTDAALMATDQMAAVTAATKIFGDGSNDAISKVQALSKSLGDNATAQQIQAALAADGIKPTSALVSAFQKYQTTVDTATGSTSHATDMQAIFGKSALDMQKIIDGGSASFDAATNKVANNTDVTKAAATVSDTLAGRQKVLKASVDDVKVSVGTALLPVITSLMQTMQKILTPIMSWVSSHEQLVSSIAKVVVPLGILTGIIWAVAAAVAAVDLSMLLIVAAIVAVIAVTVLIVKNWTPIKDFFIKLWNDVKNAFIGTWDAIKDFVTKIVNDITGFITKAWNDIKAFFMQWWPEILGIFTGGLGIIVGNIIKYHTQIWNFIVQIWNNIKDFFVGIWNTIWTDVSGVLSTISSGITKAWDTISSTVTGVVSGIQRTVLGIWDTMKSDAQTAFTDLSNAISTAWSGVEDVVKAPVKFVINTVLDDGLIGGFNTIVGAIPGLGSLKIPEIPRLAGGGVLPGFSPGNDIIPAMLSPGEGVLTPYAVQSLGGPSAIHALNGGQSPDGYHFGWGGWLNPVNDITSAAKAVGGAAAAVGKDALSAARHVAALAAKGALEPLRAGLDAIPGNNGISTIAKQVGNNSFDDVIKFIGGYENGTLDTGPTAGLAMLHPHEAVIPARMNNGLGQVHHHWHLDGTFMDNRSMDTLMDKINRHFVQEGLPTGGVQVRK